MAGAIRWFFSGLSKILPETLSEKIHHAAIRIYHRKSIRDFRRKDFPNLPVIKCEIGYNKFGIYCVPSSSRSRPAAHKILSNLVHELDTISFIREQCNEGDIIHAGTYFGDFLPAISSACSGVVWAFEPNQQNHHCAKVTILMNGLENVKLHHAGLSSSNEELFVQTKDDEGKDLGGSSRIVEQGIEGSDSVSTYAIDSAVPEERVISIIQLDVEGYEVSALQGAMSSIRRCLPILILESEEGATFFEEQWFKENILSLGYSESRRLDENRVFEVQAKN